MQAVDSGTGGATEQKALAALAKSGTVEMK
jgi:hypothetical protein